MNIPVPVPVTVSVTVTVLVSQLGIAYLTIPATYSRSATLPTPAHVFSPFVLVGVVLPDSV